MMRILYWSILILAIALTGCKAKHTGYFPLEKGAQWTYQVTTTPARGRVIERTFTIKNLGSKRFGDDNCFIRRTSFGTDYLFKQDATGIYRVGKRTIVQSRPRFGTSPRYVLKYPLEVGTEWRVKTHPYIIKRVYPYVEDYRRDISFPMSYQIAALNERVEVPAGVFDHCIRVDGAADLTLYVDPRIGWGDASVTTHEWYAPGVGLVKLERIEPLKTDVFVGGKMDFELTRFDP